MGRRRDARRGGPPLPGRAASPRTTRAWWRRPTTVSSPSFRTTCSLDIAEKADCVLELVPAMGDFVPRGGPLFRVQGSLPEPQRSAAALSVILERERSHEFEPAFGLRKLVDVGARSIYSSPFQDPTTSVQSINAIHDILRQLAPRAVSLRTPSRCPRPRAARRTGDELGGLRPPRLRRASAGRRRFAPGRAPAARRARGPEDGGVARAPPAARPSAQAARRGGPAGLPDDADVDAALVPDMQGIGSGPDVMSHPPRSASPPARDVRRPLADTAGARHG